MSRAIEPAPGIPGFSYVGHLGSGGYSEVYLYEKQHPKMKVAVKVLTGEDFTDSARQQFMDEANAMAELADHPSIVQVFSADVTPDGRPYLVMKYYPNKNMSVRASEERFGVADVLRIGIQISDAVETAHRAGILHRDIKPANILTGQFGAAGLTDFGIAATKGSENTEDSGGMSVPWAPPEVIFGTSDADERSDVYSLGATVWHLLVGRSPFVIPGGDNSQWALMRRIQEVAPPRTGRGDVPDSLERLLQQAMAKDPARRPPAALAFARALQGVEQEQHWPVTQILADHLDHRSPAIEDLADDDGATRRRPLQRVEAQTRVPDRRASIGMPVFLPESRPTVADEPSPTDVAGLPKERALPQPREARTRQFGAAPSELEGTVRRAAAGVEDSQSHQTVGSRSRIMLIGGALVLAVCAIVVGMVVMSPSSKAPPNSPSESSIPDDGLDQNALGALAERPPGVPAVQVKRADSGSVEFRWTYANSGAGDSFRWRSASGADSGVVKTALLDRKVAAGAAECIQVQVVRQDGSEESDWSSPVCSS